MATPIDPGLPRLRLLQLVSPSLPVGAFSYSQGLEWAVEAGWVRDVDSLARWLESALRQSAVPTDLPLLKRLYLAARANDRNGFGRWTDEWLAWRETAELRAEESHKGRALTHLLRDLQVPGWQDFAPTTERAFLAAYSFAAAAWRVPLREAAEAYLWGWLENQTLSAVKLVPLGQTDGQRTLYQLSSLVPELLECGLSLDDGALGGGCPALAIASSRHETQYTRLYRS